MKKENVECNKGCVNYYKVAQMGLQETKRKKTMKASPKAASNIIQASDMVGAHTEKDYFIQPQIGRWDFY